MSKQAVLVSLSINLLRYELREDLLNKWERKCADCGVENRALQVEYIHPQPKRDSD
ncbi:MULTISPECIES: hypothetical protein [Kamptonema]|uniref:hypothetical protein n=1 Tax=Kamptonema TaxID=1501433 RepID=UPI0001DAC2A4|nr:MULTISPECIES: hypothetical protein [Kamptonema]CBN56061.1 hypothetical protein OSCI_2730006 [Kamptonema sp. PCC 6506]